jgi:hypothetical protein
VSGQTNCRVWEKLEARKNSIQQQHPTSHPISILFADGWKRRRVKKEAERRISRLRKRRVSFHQIND